MRQKTVMYGDVLSEIRHEYKAKKKQLERYDRFIDRHQGLIVGGALILCLIGILIVVGITSSTTAEQLSDSVEARVIGLVSLLLLIGAIVMAFITGSRKSAKDKIEKQLAALKDEAVVFQEQSKEHNNISRDELGLWRDIEQDGNTKSKHKAIGVSVIVTVLAVLTAPFIFSQINNRNDSDNQAAVQQSSQTQTNQAQCLNDASSTYNKAWDSADTDGDGKLSYADGSHLITTDYYDAAINCYRTHNTPDSDGYIADYQAKRQQEVDSYNTRIEAVGNAAAARNNSSSSMNCTSNSIGSSTYTRCY